MSKHTGKIYYTGARSMETIIYACALHPKRASKESTLEVETHGIRDSLLSKPFLLARRFFLSFSNCPNSPSKPNRRSAGSQKRMLPVKPHHPHAQSVIPLQAPWEHMLLPLLNGPQETLNRDALRGRRWAESVDCWSASNGILAARWFPVTHERTHTYGRRDAGFRYRGAPADGSQVRLPNSKPHQQHLHVYNFTKASWS